MKKTQPKKTHTFRPAGSLHYQNAADTQGHYRFAHAPSGEFLAGIAGHIQHTHARVSGQELFCQGHSGRPRHHDIGHEQVKDALMPVGQ